jgi:RNA polymerase sigma-70 factor (ECF subfamily)
LLQKPFESKADFEIIFKDYFNPLVNFVNRYLNNYENSKEVVQNTFIKIWNQKEQIIIKTSAKAYLYQVTKNTMIDFVRNQKHRQADDLSDHLIANIEDVTEEQLDPYIVRQAFELAMKDLKDKSREIFVMNKFEGLTYDEIAEYLQISKRSVEDNIYRVSQQIKEKLKNHPYFFD